MRKYVYLLIHENGIDNPSHEVFRNRKKAKARFLEQVLKAEDCRNIAELDTAIREHELEDADLNPYHNVQEMLTELFYGSGYDRHIQVKKIVMQ